jgi:hypothetical protein
MRNRDGTTATTWIPYVVLVVASWFILVID